MEKLELKHLAPYLPYKLKVEWQVWYSKTEHRDSIHVMHPMELHNWDVDNGYVIKPILRPLSDLTKEIEVNGERFIPIEWFKHNSKDRMCFEDEFLRGIVLRGSSYSITQCSYNILQVLFEWHFDIFHLLDNNLAININDISK